MRPTLRPLSTLACLLTLSHLACSAGAREQRVPSEAPAPRPPSGAAPRSSPPPEAFARDMLASHNQARANARPAPRPRLPRLAWSAEAARQAEAWAARCTFEHNPSRGRFGENLAAATPGAWKTPDVVQSWASEAADYDLARNACTPGKVCGHYTQLVWRNTTHVGCAHRVCKRNSPFGSRFPTWELWVCNYAPPGNVVGQRPY